jgi:transcriptional regulator with XRE-family HTH domain
MLEPMNKLGAFCRKRRLDMGLTLREAGERSGLSYSEIATVERGEREDMALSTCGRLADLFGIDRGRFTAAVMMAKRSEEDPEDSRSLEDILATLQIRQRPQIKQPADPSPAVP